MARINKLTPEQEASLATYREEWLRISREFDPFADQARRVAD